jgi:hypothetical protein
MGRVKRRPPYGNAGNWCGAATPRIISNAIVGKGTPTSNSGTPMRPVCGAMSR